jgi:outer membrane receptor protein involved in Fe transport
MSRHTGRRAALALGASFIALAAATEASAQASGAGEQYTVDTIVVTAQRREETANTVGMGIQAIRGETLDQLHVTDAKDLTAFAPSFTVSQSYQGVPTYTLRGIGFNTINMSATSTVGTYTDEVAYAYPMMNTGPIYDLERVEVLKGPQGTLYGRNTTAGLIDFVTRKPTETFEAALTAEMGNYETASKGVSPSAPRTATRAGRSAARGASARARPIATEPALRSPSSRPTRWRSTSR